MNDNPWFDPGQASGSMGSQQWEPRYGDNPWGPDANERDTLSQARLDRIKHENSPSLPMQLLGTLFPSVENFRSGAWRDMPYGWAQAIAPDIPFALASGAGLAGRGLSELLSVLSRPAAIKGTGLGMGYGARNMWE